MSYQLKTLVSKFTITGGCWEWKSRIHKGYGVFFFKPGNKVIGRQAHRVVYERFVGAIPAGLDLDHVCRNKICVRPSHLEPVTHQENCIRRNAIKSHCPGGHEYTPENTYVRPDRVGNRDCRICRHDASVRARARKRARH